MNGSLWRAGNRSFIARRRGTPETTRRRLPALGRRLGVFLVVAVVGGTLAGATAQPAAAADPVLSLRITGAGTVTEVTPSGRINCTSPDTTPSGAAGADCDARYGWGWIVELRANPAPGYQFAGWQGIHDPKPVHCDGADSGHFLGSGPCKFQIWEHLGLEARFVDTTDPNTTITAGPPNQTSDTSATFFFEANQPGSRFECRLDGAGFSGCSSPQTYSGLAVGRHTFEVRAIDPSGNRDSSPDGREWTVQAPADTVAPHGTVTINNGAARTKDRKVKLSLTATDPAPGSGVTEMRIRNAGGTWSAWQPFVTTKSWTLSAGTGRRVIEVEFRDAAGNVSAIAADSITLKKRR